MSSVQAPAREQGLPAVPPGSGASRRRRLTPWQAWGLIMMAPYVIVFIAFVLYPVGYGLWLARHPASYAKLFDGTDRPVSWDNVIWMNRSVSTP